MGKFKDLTGMYFGRLKVIKFIPKNEHNKYNIHDRHHSYWLCECKCGNMKVVKADHLTRHLVRSCGCLNRETVINNSSTHKLSNTHIWRIYHNMINRCYNPNNPHYNDYGGRGITVCKEWYDPDKTSDERRQSGNPEFMNFVKWSYENGFFEYDETVPKKDRPTIDRVNNDGPYAPWNCRWVTSKIQSNNRRTNSYIYDIDGTKLTYANFENKYNLYTTEVRTKLVCGWSNDAILYAAMHPELKIHKWKGNYYDKDNFMVLIPRYNHDQQ